MLRRYFERETTVDEVTCTGENAQKIWAAMRPLLQWAGTRNLTKPEERIVDDQAEDQVILNHIQRLAAEEHRLYSQKASTKAEMKRLAKIQVKLDQCWDLLRQRRALRDVGEDPNEAEVRPPKVVEKYEQ